MFKATVGEFKGHKTISIFDDQGRYVIGFGASKARAILECIKDIENFVSDNQQSSKHTDKESDDKNKAELNFINE